MEPDMFLSPSLLHTTALLPAPLRIPCSLLLWQLLQGMFLVPIENCHPQLPSLGCPLSALPTWAALPEPRLLHIEPGPSPQALRLLLEESWALECCCLVMPAAAKHAQEAAQFLSVFSAGKFTGNEGSAELFFSAGLEGALVPSSSCGQCWSNPFLLPQALPQMDLGAHFLFL